MLEIKLTTSETDFKKCALLMSQSEPWLTLHMDFDKCLPAIKGAFKEVYVAEENSRFIGFVVLQMAGSFTGYVQTICLKPGYRGLGLGTEIIRFCEERIFKVSPNVFIRVSSFNPEAGKLYVKLGYNKVGEFPDYIVRGHSEILLLKTLGPLSEFKAVSQPDKLTIIETQTLTREQKEAIYNLWNNEYPAQLGYENMTGLDAYLDNLASPNHYFAINENGLIQGWAFTFVRENEKWFAIIVDSAIQKKGVGALLLNTLKEKEPILNGWVTDHYRYVKKNGQPYLSPFQFYVKQGFTICRDIRLEFDKLSAVKINWTRDAK